MATPDVPDTAALVHQKSTSGAVLGCFSYIPPLPKLDHLLRFLSTWGGTDKALMLPQYSIKIIIALLRALVLLRLRLNPGSKISPNSPLVALVEPLSKASALVSDARVLFRIWTTLGIVQWMIAMERNPPATQRLLTIERLQGWSMLIYGPLEAVAYLGGHGILPVSVATQNSLWLNSCRLWLAYVVLQLAHIAEDWRLFRKDAKALAIRARATTSEKDLAVTQQEQIKAKAALAARKDGIITDLLVNLGYFPLTVHWSLEKGCLSDLFVGIFGTLACAAGIRRTWQGTA